MTTKVLCFTWISLILKEHRIFIGVVLLDTNWFDIKNVKEGLLLNCLFL